MPDSFRIDARSTLSYQAKQAIISKMYSCSKFLQHAFSNISVVLEIWPAAFGLISASLCYEHGRFHSMTVEGQNYLNQTYPPYYSSQAIFISLHRFTIKMNIVYQRSSQFTVAFCNQNKPKTSQNIELTTSSRISSIATTTSFQTPAANVSNNCAWLSSRHYGNI